MELSSRQFKRECDRIIWNAPLLDFKRIRSQWGFPFLELHCDECQPCGLSRNTNRAPYVVQSKLLVHNHEWVESADILEYIEYSIWKQSIQQPLHEGAEDLGTLEGLT